MKSVEDLTSTLGKDWREILNGSQIWCIVNFFYLTQMRWTWITWHCESKFTSWKLYHLKLNHFKASLIINIVLFIHLLFVKLHHIPSNLILPCRAFHAYNLGFPWSDSSEREVHFVNRVTHTRYLKEDSS